MSFASLRRVLRSARKGLCGACSKTRYPQLEAAGAGHVGCLIYTLETIGGLIKDEHDVTAMHIAARRGQISILIYIVENNVIEKNDIPRAKNGATPAHDAAGTGNLECLRYLLNCTLASPNDLDTNAATPLHWAAQNGQLQVMQWLVLDAKASIDVMTRNGVTPFHMAAIKGHLEVLRWLVGHAFRTIDRPMRLINAKDKNGSTSVYLGSHAGNIDVVKWLTEKGGGDPTIVNKQGMAPIHAAASNGHIECVKFLFRFGLGTAPGGMRTTEGACALHFAAAEGEINIVQWLLSQEECSGDERDYYQSTPLHDAAENGHLIVLKALCDNGCDPSLLDVEGNKPADLARKNGHLKCAAYLDSYMKRVMWSKMNGIKVPEQQKAQKLRRNMQGKAQIMDKYRNAPPHIMPVNAFDEDELPYEEASQNSKKESKNPWVTVRDLLREDEMKKFNEDDDEEINSDIMEADKKRRLFEEKLAQEEEERQKKKKLALKNQKEQEDEIRTQFFQQDDDAEVLATLKSFDDILENEQQQKVAKKNKQQSKKPSKQNEEQMRKKKGSKWISHILRKRASSSSSVESNNKPIRKPRRRGSDPSEWNIPDPPPIPKLKYLVGQRKHAHSSQGMKTDAKKEVMASKWGREAYDDGNESDESSIAGSYENLSQLKLKQMQKKGFLTKTPVKMPANDKEQKKMTFTRKDTPRPTAIPLEGNKNLKQIPLDFSEQKDEDEKTTHQAPTPVAKLGSARSKSNKLSPPDSTSFTSFMQPLSKSIVDRQASMVEQPEDEEEDESTEEESSEEESTDTSDSEEDDNDDDRPIMAQNIGIHGARIAKQVMQRMKNQRYPSIFSRPIITLDTIVDVRYESPYQKSSRSEKASTLHKLHAEKRVWNAWRKQVEIINFARMQAEKMYQRRKKAMFAEIFYAWVQAKNESEVEKVERKQQALKHYKLRTKAKAFNNWKNVVNQERANKQPMNINKKYLKWLNFQLAALRRNEVTDLISPLEDGTIIIAVIAHLSGNKLPRHKQNSRMKLHHQDNWKVAHQFMKKVGVNVKDFEPADLANLQEASIQNMFNSIIKWADK